MKRRLLLFINLILLVITPFALSSGIMLEVAHGEGLGYMSNMLLTGWHGKVGFAVALLVVIHLVQRLSWYGKQMKR